MLMTSLIFCCFERFLAYTLFLPSLTVVRHQTAELNWGGREVFAPPPSIIGVSQNPSKIGLSLKQSTAEIFYGELGRRPCQFRFRSKQVKFWNRLIGLPHESPTVLSTISPPTVLSTHYTGCKCPKFH